MDEGEGGPRGDALLSDEPSVGPAPNGVELKAERRKPSGEKSCDIEDIPSLTGVLAHFRLHEFNAIRACPGGGGLIRVSEVRALPRELSSEFEPLTTKRVNARHREIDRRAFFVSRQEITRICEFFKAGSHDSLRSLFEVRFPECERNLQGCA